MSREIKTRFSTLYIKPEALKKILYYTEAADGEVSGLGVIEQNEEKQLIVSEVFLLEQESSTGDTELKGEAISKLMEDMIKTGKDSGKLKFWFHSHGSMGVFWSSTDDECAETLSKEFAFSLVVNKSGEKKCRLDLYHPFRLTIDNIRVEEVLEEDEKLKEECKKEVKEKVKEPYSYRNNWEDNRDYWKKSYRRISKKIEVSEITADDIERLLDIAQIWSENGTVFASETWDEYIEETMKEVIKNRFEKKSGCANSFGTSFGTYDKEMTMCKQCRVKKACKHWTEVWEYVEDEKRIIDTIGI